MTNQKSIVDANDAGNGAGNASNDRCCAKGDRLRNLMVPSHRTSLYAKIPFISFVASINMIKVVAGVERRNMTVR